MNNDGDSPELVWQLDNVQGIVDALTSVRWKRHQDAVIEISEHGMVIIVEETGCLQAKVYLQRELFVRYEYSAEGRPRLGVGLGLFVDCMHTFSVSGQSSSIGIRYPGPDMQLLLNHLASGDNEADLIKRNADVQEIHRRTHFKSISGLPTSIYDHERIIWLGDLNYRINLSYEQTRELISNQD